MWQRFTERARKVVFFAQEEAQKFGEGYVSTEHLLLGLVRETDSVAARVLNRQGVSLSRIRVEVEKQLPRGEPRSSMDMTLTPRAKRVIDLAYDEARNIGNNYIGTEHLLLGLIREADGLAGRVLAHCGVELDRTRRDIMDIQAESQGGISPRTVESTPSPPESPIRVPVKWRETASSLYLVSRKNTRTGVVLLSCLRDSEILQIALQDFGVDPEVIGARIESELIRRASEDFPSEPLLAEVFRVAKDLAQGLGDKALEPGFVFLAGLELDEIMLRACRLPEDPVSTLAARLREALKSDPSSPDS